MHVACDECPLSPQAVVRLDARSINRGAVASKGREAHLPARKPDDGEPEDDVEVVLRKASAWEPEGQLDPVNEGPEEDLDKIHD